VLGGFPLPAAALGARLEDVVSRQQCVASWPGLGSAWLLACALCADWLRSVLCALIGSDGWRALLWRAVLGGAFSSRQRCGSLYVGTPLAGYNHRLPLADPEPSAGLLYDICKANATFL